MRVGLFWRVLPVHFLIVIALAVPLWQRSHAAAIALQAGQRAQARLINKVAAPIAVKGTPTRIIIPRLAIDIAVVPQSYNEQRKTWAVAPSAANYATDTSLANDQNDAPLIYGHWTSQVFGPTKNLQTGDVAYIYTDNDHVLKYEYSGNEIVQPTNLQVFKQLKGKPGLALMTCDGSWAQNRRFMFFKLVTAQ